MKRLLYFSIARDDMDDAQVDAIVAQAAHNNLENGVTGALGYNGRYFCQLLEGRVEVIDSLVQKIRDDARHSGFRIIEEKKVDTRVYEDWAMMRVDNLHIQHIIDAMDT